MITARPIAAPAQPSARCRTVRRAATRAACRANARNHEVRISPWTSTLHDNSGTPPRHENSGPPKADPWNDTSGEAAAAACAKGCASLANCNLDYATCVFDCGRNPGFTDCFAAQDCTERAACIFGKNCGGARPEGTTSCLTAAQCQASCGVDPVCLCGCMHDMQRSQAILLFRLDACASNCGTDMECVNRECQTVATACRIGR